MFRDYLLRGKTKFPPLETEAIFSDILRYCSVTGMNHMTSQLTDFPHFPVLFFKIIFKIF